MPGAAITESDSFPATVTTPLAGEPASATALLSEFLQGMANRSRYLYNRLLPFINGGNVSPSGSLTITPSAGGVSIAVPAGHVATLNASLSVEAAADGGGVTIAGADGLSVTNAMACGAGGTFAGRVRAPKGVVAGAVTAGTHQFSISTTDHVYGTVAPASTTTWQIATNVGVGIGETIRFVNFGPGSAVVKDNLGNTLATLIGATSSALYAVTCAYDGANFGIVDTSYYP